MVRYIIILAFFFSVMNFQALTQDHNKSHFSLIRIELTEDISLDDLYEYGLCVEDGKIKSNSHIELIVNEQELSLLIENDIEFDMLFSDYEKHLANKAPKKYKRYYDILNSTNFSLGSVGGFHTLKEIQWEFDIMKEKYPEYFEASEVIGKSVEDRDIHAYCFGNKSKPEILLTGLHHAREPIGATMILYFLWKLMELAASGDQEAEYLLHERAIWVIPVINPDGWLYNYSRYPDGGGLWRKNRQLVASTEEDSTYGVDLNRNYGPYDYWNAPNNGSSTRPSSSSYRGTYPFSEPELQAVRDFCLEHEFLFALNYHSYGNYLIYPYHALSGETPDSLLFRSFSRELSRWNRFSFGTSLETVRYPARGTSDDWMYLEDGDNNRIIAITPEIGSVNETFYPKPERIAEMVAENFYMNLQTCWSAGMNLRPYDLYYDHDSTEANSLVLRLRNIGLQSGKARVKVRSLDPLFNVLPEYEIDLKEIWREKDLELDLIVNKPHDVVQNGDIYDFEVEIEQNGVFRRDTFAVKLMCYDELILFDSKKQCDPNTKWIKNDWGYEYSEDFNRFVLSDSPQAYYSDSADNYLIYRDPVYISKPSELVFTTTWNIEPNDDFGIVQISTDAGENWECIRTSRMVKGSGRHQGRQDTSLSGFHGNYTGWATQRYDLSYLTGNTINIRFGLISDRGGSYDGWKIKDVIINEYGDCPLLSSDEEKEIPDVSHSYFIVDQSSFKLNNLGQDLSLYADVIIYDIYGSVFYKDQINTDQLNEIPVLNWPPGNYFIKITDKSGKNVFQRLLILN